jgi:hypothetical protein
MQISSGEDQEFGERAIAIDNAEGRAAGAVRYIAVKAGRAGAIICIDFADDPRVLRRAIFDNADELMTKDTAKAHVALDDFEIGIADAGAQNSNK